jgi:hypothetical protein
MTAGRQQRKRQGAMIAAFAGLWLVLFAGPSARPAAATERVVVDWNSGLAMGGYDPVGFYTQGKPVLGNADVELVYGGAIWRFCNIGNRAAFAAHPDVYMPQFGGYDPIGVARGLAVAGNPSLWLIAAGRLFLFYNRARLDSFVADAERIMAAAERKWPELASTLNP